MSRRIVKLVLGKDHKRRLTLEVPITLIELREKITGVCSLRHFEIYHRTDRGDLHMKNDKDVQEAFGFGAGSPRNPDDNSHIRLLIWRKAQAPAEFSPPVVNQPTPTDDQPNSMKGIPYKAASEGKTFTSDCLTDPCPPRSETPEINYRRTRRAGSDVTNQIKGNMRMTQSFALPTSLPPFLRAFSGKREEIDRDVFESSLQGLDLKLRQNLDSVRSCMKDVNSREASSFAPICDNLMEVATHLQSVIKEMQSLNHQLAYRSQDKSFYGQKICADVVAQDGNSILSVNPSTHQIVISMSPASSQVLKQSSVMVSTLPKTPEGEKIHTPVVDSEAKSQQKILPVQIMPAEQTKEANKLSDSKPSVVTLSTDDIKWIENVEDKHEKYKEKPQVNILKVSDQKHGEQKHSEQKQGSLQQISKEARDNPMKNSTEFVDLQKSLGNLSADLDDKMDQLAKLGWSKNPTFNRVLLKMHDGDVEKVIEDLKHFNSYGGGIG